MHNSKTYLPYPKPIPIQHVSTNVNRFRVSKGGLGGFPPISRRIVFKKKSNERRLFLYGEIFKLFFFFFAGLPKSPKL